MGFCFFQVKKTGAIEQSANETNKPGSMGTIQEIFQEACQNHYKVIENTVSPMIFVDKVYWMEVSAKIK